MKVRGFSETNNKNIISSWQLRLIFKKGFYCEIWLEGPVWVRKDNNQTVFNKEKFFTEVGVTWQNACFASYPDTLRAFFDVTKIALGDPRRIKQLKKQTKTLKCRNFSIKSAPFRVDWKSELDGFSVYSIDSDLSEVCRGKFRLEFEKSEAWHVFWTLVEILAWSM